MFGHDAQCPVQAADRDSIEGSFGWLSAQFGTSLLASPVLLPTSDYFPGPFSGELAEMRALVAGIAEAMEMDISRLAFVRFPGERAAPTSNNHTGFGFASGDGLNSCPGYQGGVFGGGGDQSRIALGKTLAKPDGTNIIIAVI